MLNIYTHIQSLTEMACTQCVDGVSRPFIFIQILSVKEKESICVCMWLTLYASSELVDFRISALK